MKLLEINKINKSFGSNDVLRGISLSLEESEVSRSSGHSGSGKSTLLRILAGLDAGATGEIRSGREPAVVFQDPRLFPWRRALENVDPGAGGDQVDAGNAHPGHAAEHALQT